MPNKFSRRYYKNSFDAFFVVRIVCTLLKFPTLPVIVHLNDIMYLIANCSFVLVACLLSLLARQVYLKAQYLGQSSSLVISHQ